MPLSKIVEANDVTAIAKMLVFGRFGMSNLGTDKLYTQMSNFEYLTMEQISSLIQEKGDGTRIYMKEVAEALNVEVSRLSHTLSKLEEQALIEWKHDPDSDTGTYITLTESGKKRLDNQEKILKEFYQKVLKDFGKERAVNLVEEMVELEKVMRKELDAQ
ncbi:MAG: winged helix DNA-binding protein [Ruminococcus sp.]|jgi:DNA-binding MarR family transcriptional regulator